MLDVKSSTPHYSLCAHTLAHALIFPVDLIFTDSFDFYYEYKGGKLQVDDEFFQEKFALSKSKVLASTHFCYLFVSAELVACVVPNLFVCHIAIVTKVNKNCQIIGLSCVSSKTTDAILRSIHATVSRSLPLMMSTPTLFSLLSSMNESCCRCSK